MSSEPGMVAPTACENAKRPLRGVSAVFLALGVAVALTDATSLLSSAFCSGSSAHKSKFRVVPDIESAVSMGIRSRRWSGGRPNMAEINREKMQSPSLNNVKDQYFILYARSPKIKHWYAINIVSGSEAAKNLKGATNNDLAKAVGVDKLAQGQVVKALGMSMYKQNDEVMKNAREMHPPLNYASKLQYGYKEILNNTEFNKNPVPFLQLTNISLIPPEEELRNILDDAGDKLSEAGTNLAKVGDNVKGFLGR
eukprot:TRINITY_DN340_c0_g1_i1.p1 TRINITY_DN340_c0_g1~~TRINITY_DN340_c0_g1_i1.p1  ORF type:complete len:268 (-),score=47.79 TRINITY_DN340_c0_g1_i1:81-839(-)